ncbi:hypothetical protein [Agromyces subbeticus]|uniref:hypothetical protein n=1 Tax=Agromyces subbeticus TaxID=293890 RepID=UPI0003B3180C|nr:hypothetical protein [Agromyces subbeticus]
MDHLTDGRYDVAAIRTGDRVAFTFASVIEPEYEVTGLVYLDGSRLRVDAPEGRFVVRGELGHRNPFVKSLRVLAPAAAPELSAGAVACDEVPF